MDRDGGNARRLTTTTASETATAWSPDGSRLLFGSDEGGGYDVLVINADGSDRRALTTAPAYDGAADRSPDGARVVFRSERDGNSEIYVMNADGSGQTRLTNTPGAEDGPRWSPDGSRIAFQYRDAGKPSEIRVMNADGSGVRSFTDPTIEHYHPDWSPDGSRVVCVSEPPLIGGEVRAALRSLFVINADGTGRRRLTFGDVYAILPRWAPDGQTIAYTSVVGGRYQLRMMNADGTGSQTLSVPGRSDYLAVWRP
jgi:Tol biopolymer transport system component